MKYINCRRCTASMALTEDDIETVLCEECEQIISEYDPEHQLEEYRDKTLLIPGDFVVDPILLEKKNEKNGET